MKLGGASAPITFAATQAASTLSSPRRNQRGSAGDPRCLEEVATPQTPNVAAGTTKTNDEPRPNRCKSPSRNMATTRKPVFSPMVRTVHSSRVARSTLSARTMTRPYPCAAAAIKTSQTKAIMDMGSVMPQHSRQVENPRGRKLTKIDGGRDHYPESDEDAR